MNTSRSILVALTVAAVLPGWATTAATLQVDTAADELNANGQCSLREAVINANNGDQSGSTDCAAGTGPVAGEFDTIEFAPALDGTPIVLDIIGAGEDAGASGDIDVTDNLGIIGNGAGATILDGSDIDRVLDAPGPDPALSVLDLLVEGVTVRNGSNVTAGAGIRANTNTTTLLVEDATITSNFASGSSGVVAGGGIFADGALSLDNVSLSGNQVFGASGADAVGGAVGAAGTFLGQGLTVTGNGVQTDSGEARGGGLAAGDNESPFLLEFSTVRDNEAIATAGGSATGGGIAVEDVSLGGADPFSGISGSLVSDNRALADGGAASGGGIAAAAPASLLVFNTTLSGNSAGDGATLEAFGGGLINAEAFVALNNTTVADNGVDATDEAVGGGLISLLTSEIGVANSIVALNQAPGSPVGLGPDCFGTVVSAGYTLLGSNLDCDYDAELGDIVGDVDGGASPVDPMLGPLADNGGPTQTRALLAASPAVDTGNPDPDDTFLTRCSDSDQRGFLRPVDGDDDGDARCDMGAYEFASFLEVFFMDGFEES